MSGVVLAKSDNRLYIQGKQLQKLGAEKYQGPYYAISLKYE